MRIPVLLALPSHPALHESAMAMKEKRPPTIQLESANIPANIALDRSFPAVPIGTGSRDTVMSDLEPANSNEFLVRGFVDVSTPNDIPPELHGRRVFSDPHIQPLPICLGSPPVGSGTVVVNKLQVPALSGKGLDGSGVAIAIMDLGINLKHLTAKLGTTVLFDAGNSLTPSAQSPAPGKYPVNHGTMCAFDALLAAPKATLLDFPILSISPVGGNTVGSSLSAAFTGYSQLIANWAIAFAPSAISKYSALVVSNSWGIYHPSWDFPTGHPGRYIDNPDHPFNVLIGTLASSGADILFSAGNCGAQCPDPDCQGRTSLSIMGANALSDVLTIAGCDTTDQRAGYSSQGPAITGMSPKKPDLACYTHFLGSQAFGPSSADSGTSAACPVAAGCVAALRTKCLPSGTPPAQLFAQLRSTARTAQGTASWNADYGYGILDPLAAAISLGL